MCKCNPTILRIQSTRQRVINTHQLPKPQTFPKDNNAVVLSKDHPSLHDSADHIPGTRDLLRKHEEVWDASVAIN